MPKEIKRIPKKMQMIAIANASKAVGGLSFLKKPTH